MKVKGKNKLQQIANDIWTKYESELKPCEFVYVLSQLTNRMSLEMLKAEMRR
jgi:hypothetical protein